MKLVVISVFLLVLGFGFAQETSNVESNSTFSLQACDDVQMTAESDENGKTELEFASDTSITKCFRDFDTQLKDASWKRSKSDGNMYNDKLYRVVYINTESGAEATFMLRQTDTGFKAMFDL